MTAGVACLLMAGVAAAATQPPAPATPPPPPVARVPEAADPSAGAGELAAASQAEHDQVVAYLRAVAAERAAAVAAAKAAARAARNAPAGRPVTGDVWDRLAQCESNGRWHLDDRYDGGLQFDPPTWTATKDPDDPPYAWQASPDRQIAVARKLQARSGWGQWPRCARRLGLR